MSRLRTIAREASPRRRRRRRRFPALERLSPPARKVVLTFDDGPDADTPAVLDVLDELRISAAFFLLGEQVERLPELARAVAARGHEVGLHGSRHFRHDLRPREGAADIRDGLSQLRAAIGSPPRWYRPPFGRFSDESWAACSRFGLRPVHWYATGRDWRDIGAGAIAGNVARDLAEGAIVLLHDSARYAERRSAQPTVDAIPIIAEAVRSRGLEFGTLGP
jgi:peptidoglycan/xylan/chitin deacetylase (PgdA/CDA1 family)